MNENRSTIVKEYEFDKPLLHERHSVIDEVIRGFHNNYLHKFKYECIYISKLIKTGAIDPINLTISGKSMDLYDLNKK